MILQHFISNEEITIYWERGEWLSSEDRQHSYIMHGEGNDGKKYIGTGVYCCGELQEVIDIDYA